MAGTVDHNTLIQLTLDQVAGLGLHEAEVEIAGEAVSYETVGKWRRRVAKGKPATSRLTAAVRDTLIAFLQRKGIDVSRETQPSPERAVNAPAPAYVEALSEAAGTLELMAMGLRQKVANLRGDSPVAPAPLRTADEDQRDPTTGGACG